MTRLKDIKKKTITVGDKVAVNCRTNYGGNFNGVRGVVFGTVKKINNLTMEVLLIDGKYIQRVKPRSVLKVSRFADNPRGRKVLVPLKTNLVEATLSGTTPQSYNVTYKGLNLQYRKHKVIKL